VVDRAIRALVRERAADRCEYCGLRQEELPLTAFHVEHVIPRQHGGSDDPQNLALACHHCNFHKGPNLSGIDPESGAIVPLYHPRREVWEQHFALQDVMVVGLTPTGRATVRVLLMNSPTRLELRREARNPP
jgi:hypothetical protein